MGIKSIVGIATALVAMAGGTYAVAAPGAPAPVQPAAAVQPVGAQLGHAPACTVRTSMSRAAATVKPGDVVCFSGDLKAKRLKISKGGTKDKPVTYSGKGQEVGGIDIDADYVVVDGYTMNKPSAPGIEVHGNGVTVQNNTVTSPKGGDGDGMRYFGNDNTISHNTVSKTDNSTGAHADCMQTFATDDEDVASKNLTVDSNQCKEVDNMCLMAEGPNSEAGDGSGEGVSENWKFTNNYCQTMEASQELMVDDVQHMTITGNTWVKGVDHAIGLQNKSTNATVKDNKLDPDIDCEVGMDSSSKKGYQGPKSKCDP